MAELTLLDALLLGIVQGLTEWLPVSSSGHLVLAQALVGVDAPILFELAVHVGTLLVVLVFFRSAIARILRALAAAPADRRRSGSWRVTMLGDPDRRLAVMVVVGTIPVVVVGLAFADLFEAAFSSVTAVGVALLVTGTLVWLTKHARPPRSPGDVRWRDAVVIGLAQAAAVTPGISRSGATIAAALHSGVDRETAVTYSFLLSIPAIAGATVLGVARHPLESVRGDALAFAVGTLAAVVVGYASLAFLVFVMRRRSLHHFAYYSWAVGAAALAWGLAGGA